MIVIKAVTKNLQVFLSHLENLNLEDLHIFQLCFILVNVDRVYDIVPMK